MEERMTEKDSRRKISIDPPNHARPIGKDKHGREHRYDPHDSQMFVELPGATWSWVVGPCPDLREWIDEMEREVGWDDLRYSDADAFEALADQVRIVEEQ